MAYPKVDTPAPDERTRKELIDELARATTSFDTLHEETLRLREGLSEREREVKETRAQFDDLKTRLQAAEKTNQYMRGYLARVQEDDVVREELLTVGEPGGEQHLVPKRKPAAFSAPDDFTDFTPRGESSMYHQLRETDEQRSRRRRHWITY